MKREIIVTTDGSHTIHLPELNESYHSKHGAIQEAKHVFINNGLSCIKKGEINILEIGFGTGLNALLTNQYAINNNKTINYTGVEAFPVAQDEVVQLNYPILLNDHHLEHDFAVMHEVSWNKTHHINANFSLCKRQQQFEDINDQAQFDVIYFDAFGYRVQPELWSDAIFDAMFKALKPNGILVTYACRSVIKKSMDLAGFKTEKLPGPPGKREMLRGVRL